MAVAGYNVVLNFSKIGTPTAFSSESMSSVTGITKGYKIDSTSKDIWNQDATTTIYDNGSPVSDSNIDYIDYLFGVVKFIDSYSVTGSITADGEYYATMSVLTNAHDHTFSLTNNVLDVTDYTTDGYKTRINGIKEVNLDVSRFYTGSLDNLEDIVLDKETIVLEFKPNSSSNLVFRGFFIAESEDLSASIDDIEDVSFTFNTIREDKNVFSIYFNG